MVHEPERLGALPEDPLSHRRLLVIRRRSLAQIPATGLPGRGVQQGECQGIVTASEQHSADANEPVPTATPVAAVIVLAAGQGTRMRSSLPKVMHEIAGRPLLWHALRAAAEISPQRLVAVIGHGRELVQDYLSRATDLAVLPIATAIQAEQKGTGHAVQCALSVTGPLTGTVIVSYGDVPLLRGETLQDLAAEHQQAGNAVTVLTAVVPDATGYGRITRTDGGAVTAIVEHRDADAATREIHEINTGVYAFDGALLTELIGQLRTDNAQGELYLTDVVHLAVAAGRPVGALVAKDAAETEGVNDRVQLADMAGRLRAELVRRAQLAGVTILDPATTYLHADVTIGADSVILPGTHLEAGTVIGAGCTIGPDTTLIDCRVDDGASVVRSHCQGAHIGAGAQVGPFTHLRPGSDLREGAVVGAFVEVKKAVIGAGAKAHHLAYLGDATVGAGANIGAGVITANYDGVHKSATTIGAQSFVGSNATLVAPITVADGSYVAAGSVITDDVAAGDLAVARGLQHNSAGWVLRRRTGTPSAEAAQAAKGSSGSDHPAVTSSTVSTDNPTDIPTQQKGHPAP
jgi:bifunctional UDP-N-acetylglucosamine pyrophosphorylase/glucosamine-1-phosphate N-acetyltransferase